MEMMRLDESPIAYWLPEAGHCCNMDNPRAFNRCLEQFWELPA